jgi:nicotinamidase-related amidase
VTDAATRDHYAGARIGERLRRGTRPVVLVIDLQYGFTDPREPLAGDLSAVVEATRTVLDVARACGVPRVFTAYALNEEGTDGGILVQKMPGLLELRRGTRLVEIDERLARRPAEPVVYKQGFSGLGGSRTLSLLLAARADTIVLCGTTTSGCIRATAIDLIEAGLPALIPRPAVGDRTEAAHENSLFDIDSKHADVVELDDVVGYLESISEAE